MTIKIGATVGKFMPLHKGHELLIQYGSKMMDQFVVLVSGREDDVISLSIRYNWVTEYVRRMDLTNVKVVKHVDTSPTPINIDDDGTVLDVDFQYYWADQFTWAAGPLTHIVTSDMYGKAIAKTMGVKWLPVDPNREMISISATMIRENPVKHFDKISDVAKPYFTKKVAVVGPESSGKSTIVRHLSQLGLRTHTIVTEYGRTLSEVFKNDLDSGDFMDIANGQQAMIDIAVTNTKVPIVLIDTEAYTTYLFSGIYLEHRLEDIKQMGHDQEIDHYIVMSPNISWVDDGTRVLGNQEDREKFFHDLLRLLDDGEKSYTIVDNESPLDRYLSAKRVVRSVQNELS